MSDLSFLIGTQKLIQIDHSYLQKCQQTHKIKKKQSEMRKSPWGLTKILSYKQIKLKKTQAQFGMKGKSSLQKSFKHLFSCQSYDKESYGKSSATSGSQMEEILKIAARMEALQENQKLLEQNVGVQLFQIKESMVQWGNDQRRQQNNVQQVIKEVKEAKIIIDQLFSLITQKGK